MTERRIVVIGLEFPWPTNNGGRTRSARICDELLAAGAQLRVAAPGPPPEIHPAGVECISLADPERSTSVRVRGTISRYPRLGWVHLGHNRSAIEQLAADADTVVWTSDVAAAFFGRLPCRTVIDLADIQFRRLASLAAAAKWPHSSAKLIEAHKARSWEPRTWRRADLVSAITQSDAECVAAAGANVVVAPNGLERRMVERSPDDGYVVMVGSFDYPPNRLGAEWFMQKVWPLVRARLPSLPLVVAGRAAGSLGRGHSPAGIEVISDFTDTAEIYGGSILAIAPVSVGGGAQLKIVEALSHGRAVVARPYSFEAVPPQAVAAGQVRFADTAADFAAAIFDLATNSVERRKVETCGWAGPDLRWSATLQPLVHFVMDAPKAG